MVGWHHRLNGHEFEQTLGDSKGQGSLACCTPWGRKELEMIKQLNSWKREILENYLTSSLMNDNEYFTWEILGGELK